MLYINTLKNWIWPVGPGESRKLIPLLVMKFCASFIYTLLHATKDTLVVTTKGSGAEVIPILKGGVVLVLAFVMMLVYTKLSQIFTRKQLFYTTLSPFILFFALYGFVLYPNQSWLCPHQSADWLAEFLGEGRQSFVAVYRFWMNSLFFVMSELWGGMVINLLFWGFCNQICSVNEASRFYSIFSGGGNVGVIIAGPLIYFIAKIVFPNDYLYTVQSIMGLAIFLTLVMVAMFWWINRNVCDIDESAPAPVVKKKKPTLFESLKCVASSKSLGMIALMVIGYGLSVTLVEVSWKAALQIQYPSSSDYHGFMALVEFGIGILALFLSFFVGGNIIRRLGWHFAAMSTPVILGFCTLLFFGIYWISFEDGVFTSEFGLYLLILVGTIHNIACKAMKYCLFDPSKEIAYIPLSEDEKVKGKAAVDVVGARLGKSGASWIQTLFIELSGLGSVLNISLYLAPFAMGAIGVWMFAAKWLSLHFIPGKRKDPVDGVHLHAEHHEPIKADGHTAAIG